MELAQWLRTCTTSKRTRVQISRTHITAVQGLSACLQFQPVRKDNGESQSKLTKDTDISVSSGFD